MGTYGLAYKVHDNLILGAAFLVNALFPILSKCANEPGLNNRLRLIYKKSFDILFMAGIYIFTFFSAMGFRFNIMYFMVPFLSALFVVLGIFLPKLKKNYFVGIRTPWTLQSDEVWIKTHKFGAKCFITAGVLGIFTVFLKSELAFWVFIIVMIIAALLPVIYSYFVYRRMNLFQKEQ